MTGGEVSGNLFAPDRDDCLRAISRSLLAVLNLEGASRKKLARILDCGPDKVDAGVTEANLISFDTIALLLHHFPKESAPLHALWGRERPEWTADDHKAAIEHHTAELLRMAREGAK